MGQKVHPYGFRLGIIRQSRSRWFAEGPKYRRQLLEDLHIREHIMDRHRNAGISDVFIERRADTVTVTIQTAKPGIIIGRGGRDVDKLRQEVEQVATGRIRVNVEETPQPDLNAQLMAENIAHELERRISPRRAMGQAIERAMNVGAEGARCQVSGRIRGAEIARTESMGPEGRVPLQTLRADIDYGFAEATTSYGPIGVKAWIYKGEILPPKKKEEPELLPQAEHVLEGLSATADEVMLTSLTGGSEAPMEEALTDEEKPVAPAEVEEPAAAMATEAESEAATASSEQETVQEETEAGQSEAEGEAATASSEQETVQEETEAGQSQAEPEAATASSEQETVQEETEAGQSEAETETTDIPTDTDSEGQEHSEEDSDVDAETIETS